MFGGLTLLLASSALFGSAWGEEKLPYLINNEKCLSKCNNEGGPCEEYCGDSGFCCRKHFGECMQSFENVAPKDHHSCVRGTEEVRHREAEKLYACQLTVLPAKHVFKDNKVFGTLDVLPAEFSVSLDFQPLINSSVVTKYSLVFYSKSTRGKGGEIIVEGNQGIYKILFCGSLSGMPDHNCVTLNHSVRVKEWIHVHMHQVKNRFDIFVQKVIINHVQVREGKNSIAEDLRDVAVVGLVLPKVPNAGVIGNLKVGACNAKFDASNKGI